MKPTPEDAARWLRENGPSVVWPTVTVERYAAYAAHVLGRVVLCRDPIHRGEDPAGFTDADCPFCAGRGWTLTEAT